MIPKFPNPHYILYSPGHLYWDIPTTHHAVHTPGLLPCNLTSPTLPYWDRFVDLQFNGFSSLLRSLVLGLLDYYLLIELPYTWQAAPKLFFPSNLPTPPYTSLPAF